MIRENSLPHGEISFLAFCVGKVGGSHRDRDRGNLTVAGHGGMGGLDLSGPSVGRPPLSESSFPNDVFMGHNKSAIITGLMQEAVEKEQRKTGTGSLSEHTLAQKERTRYYRRTVTHRT